MTLQWPTAIAVNPIDNTLYILDNNVVLKLTQHRKILAVAGRPPYCPARNHSSSSGEDLNPGSRLAIDSPLDHPQHISFSQEGDLYIVESHGRSVNRIRLVDMAGHIMHYVGATPSSPCDCFQEPCICPGTKDSLAVNLVLDNPTAIAVTPDGVLHISDMGSLRIYSIVSSEPVPDRLGQIEVINPLSQEVYIFNRYGKHILTKSQLTDQPLYNFSYSTNSFYEKVARVMDARGNVLSFRRDYVKSVIKEINTQFGHKCKLTTDAMGQLQAFVSNDNVTTRFSYLGNTGLLESKETSDGHTFLYEYDDIGRLSAVVMPTGERSTIETDMDSAGARVTFLDEGVSLVSMSTNGNSMTRIQGNYLVAMESSVVVLCNVYCRVLRQITWGALQPCLSLPLRVLENY